MWNMHSKSINTFQKVVIIHMKVSLLCQVTSHQLTLIKYNSCAHLNQFSTKSFKTWFISSNFMIYLGQLANWMQNNHKISQPAHTGKLYYSLALYVTLWGQQCGLTEFYRYVNKLPSLRLFTNLKTSAAFNHNSLWIVLNFVTLSIITVS